MATLREKSDNREISDIKGHIANLEKIGTTFLKVYDFKVGDFVVWKEGLKNRTFPAYNEPCYVVSVLDEPMYDEKEEYGSPNFNEPLDLFLGMIDEDGDFLTYHYDKRRFEPYTTK